jgi:Transposase IS116/IS110/IS902 family
VANVQFRQATFLGLDVYKKAMLAAWVAHRRRKVASRSALANQVIVQLDLVFPGLDRCFSDVLGANLPGVAVVRASDYAAGIGDPAGFANAAGAYRFAVLVPTSYQSAGGPRPGQHISREGSVELRQAVIELGRGLSHDDDFVAYRRRLHDAGKAKSRRGPNQLSTNQPIDSTRTRWYVWAVMAAECHDVRPPPP